MNATSRALTASPNAATTDAPARGSGVTTRTLRRLRRMPLTEVAYRSWQEASKFLERLSPAGREIDPAAWFKTHAPELRDPQAVRQLFRQRLPRRFFAGAVDPQTPVAIDARFPAVSREIVATADTLIGKHFDLLGYQGLSFGDPIDWHADPVWRRRAPIEHWSLLDPLDPAEVGDSKIVWELNRHQWLVRLAQAWRMTGRERYALACVDAIDAWREANPRGTGINWTSSLEVSYRLMSWCWTAALLRDAAVLSDRWMVALLMSIGQHAEHIARYLSYYSSPNTHLTGEALGLFYAGTLFPEFRDASQWRSAGMRVLLAESRAQLFPDGVHFEQATCYHRYTVDTYLQFLLLARHNQITVPREIFDQVKHMVEFLAAVQRPDGVIPAIGDGDGGSLLPLEKREQGDARGMFAVAAAVFNRPDFAWTARGAASELLWLLGDSGLQAFDSLRPALPSASPSRLFPSGGYGVMASDWSHDAHQMIVDVGPLGCTTSSGHGHADLLSIQCSIFGEACLVDSGTYCYTAEPIWRDFFRSTAAHSTVRVDELDQAESAGPFRWHQRPRTHLRTWQSDSTCDVLDADHNAYRRLADPVTCRRRVIFVKPDYWLVVDDLEGTSTHHVSVAFQFAPTMKVSLGPDSWTRAETPKGRVLWMLSIQSSPLQASVACGTREPLRGWVSSNYGLRQPAPVLTYSGAVALPSRTITLLLPDSNNLTLPPIATPVFDDDHRPAGVMFEPPRRSVRIDDRAVVITN